MHLFTINKLELLYEFQILNEGLESLKVRLVFVLIMRHTLQQQIRSLGNSFYWYRWISGSSK